MLLFDIGANIGKWAVSNVNIYDRIIAVEPGPTAFAKLVENVDMLPRSISRNIETLNLVVYDSRCNDRDNENIVDFYECKKHRYSTTNKAWIADKKSRFYGKEYNTIKCKTIRLDTMVSVYGIPDLIKIDVEGGEYECLQTLTQKVPNVCFEWVYEFKDLANKCLDYLFRLGFRFVYLQYEDDYTFRPSDKDYKFILDRGYVMDMNDIIKLHDPPYNRRCDWGMIWCK